jgi:hypothetical protein
LHHDLSQCAAQAANSNAGGVSPPCFCARSHA